MISKKLTDSRNHPDREYFGISFSRILKKILKKSDLLWSDPVENDDGICENTYKSNEVRGCSYFFG